ncbi:DUF4833 domain-containing protein [Flavobacterium jejuense]|uniref:DUF4833 domain-containing protein n=1 Tax=Flavobacterium jejuense TaxID=1544455 RepID=A0ABX0IRS5_9FLAO|nr:DUF4833 domain-containing protein [Flavobacterium jejuense]NHN26271.1 DUF4833 domain-containing protein [Flavobacterium jejuense]
MKIIVTLFCTFFYIYSSFSQSNYPEPEKTATRLFYIQHSNNHNTYVYDANIKGGIIDSSQPIKEYQIVYTENGIKKPLTNTQKKLAYGMILQEAQHNLFKFRLAASGEIDFYLKYTASTGAKIYVTVNKHKMYLDKMFVKLKEGFLGIKTNAEYVLFYGKDFYTGKSIIEKVIMD